VSRKKEQ